MTEIMVLGRIVAPFGIKGWLKIHPFGDDPLSWAEMPQWWIAADADAPAASWQPFAVQDCREHGPGLVVAFEEVTDRNRAESLKGWFVGAPREAMPATAENEYYWRDLTGLTVENRAGEVLGTVTGLLSTGAHDVLRVGDAAQESDEKLIPFVDAYIDGVDTAARRIRVDWQKDW